MNDQPKVDRSPFEVVGRAMVPVYEPDEPEDDIDHGTYRGSQRCRVNNGKPCDPCRIARNEYVNAWRRNRSNTVMKYRIGTAPVSFPGGHLAWDGEPSYSPMLDSQNEVDETLERWFLGDDAVYRWLIVWVEEAAEPKWRTM